MGEFAVPGTECVRPFVRGVEDPVLMESRPAAESAQPACLPPIVDPDVHLDAHGHFSEIPLPTIGPPRFRPLITGNPEDDAAQMSHAPKERHHNFAEDISPVGGVPWESRRRYSDQYVDKPKGPDNNNFIPTPLPPKPPQLKCSDDPNDKRANTPCPPGMGEPTVGQSVKNVAGKTWSIIQHFFGSDDQELPPQRSFGAPPG